ncbi:MAG: hypothetical protein ACYDBB_05115 [Armatimonadota bacterium]
MARKASPLFGKINVYDPEGGKQNVEIYIKLDQRVENMKVGIAIDGSASMLRPMYGAHLPLPILREQANIVAPVVRHLARYVCDFTGDGTVDLIYWAVGPGGSNTESIGRVDAAGCDTIRIDGPKKHPWGTGTRLLPALQHYTREFADAEWAILLFITDGRIEDTEDVKAHAMAVGQEIINGTRKNLKLVVVGLTHVGIKPEEIEVMKEGLDELDNMFEGTELGEEHGIDLWDCKLASDMEELSEIWDEVDFGIAIDGTGRILDGAGREVMHYADSIPQRLEFKVPEGTKEVTVEIFGQTIVQPLE